MPNTKWSELDAQQLGRYAEYYSKMEFASYGLEVYTSEVDDHGVDFVAKNKNGMFWEVQVKSLRALNYIFSYKKHFDISQPNLLLHLLMFKDGSMPESYLIPATEWQQPNMLLCQHDYVGKESEPEYGMNISKRNLPLLQRYRIEEIIPRIKESKP